MTQTETVLKHLRAHGKITRMEAMNIYQICDLRKCISNLRAMGHQIDTVKREDLVHNKFTEYQLKETRNVAAAA